MTYDKDFLRRLDECQHKEIFARLIALNFDEQPVEQIEGRVTGGSISVDGTSAVRRTCNITLTPKDLNINNFYWGLTNKFKVEIGVKNNIDNNYPEIIWFNQGMYLITGFNTSISTNNYSISISGKDKMCLLNGDIGGNLTSSVDFGAIDNVEYAYEPYIVNKTNYRAHTYYIKSGDQYILSDNEYSESATYYRYTTTVSTETIKLKTIIKEALHTYGNEHYYNIIINDLDDVGLELMEYRGDNNLYVLYNKASGEYTNMTTNAATPIKRVGSTTQITLGDLADDELDTLVADYRDEAQEVVFVNDVDQTKYTIAKLTYGDCAGYRQTDLVYSGDLISSIGETLTSILDKIKNMLGDFEYFYDLEGHFVFQKKKTYVNTSWNTIVKNNSDEYVEASVYNSSCSYDFTDNVLITAFANNPALNNLKNDYSVWGKRKGASGATIPIHARYAIDKKPSYYKAFDETVYTDNWREIIYQMACDYYKHNQEDDFLINVEANNIINDANGSLYPQGKTGYEQYYIDMQGFWRQIYNPNPTIEYEGEYGYYNSKEEWQPYTLTGNIICDYYITTAQANAIRADFASASTAVRNQCEESLATLIKDEYAGWHTNVIVNPSALNFWIDFLDEAGELDQFAVYAVGDRSKVVNDDKVTSIYFREVPSIIYKNRNDEQDVLDGYTAINIPQYMENLFSISARGKCAKDSIDELLYQYSYCIENASITSIPIYYLEPNTRIYIYDEKTKINGEYIASKFTIPLAYNGTMSITATKAPDRLY